MVINVTQATNIPGRHLCCCSGAVSWLVYTFSVFTHICRRFQEHISALYDVTDVTDRYSCTLSACLTRKLNRGHIHARMSLIRAVLVDLSGTLHIEDNPTPRAVQALDRLKARHDLQVKFVTNTTKESNNFLLTRLHAIGFNVDRSEVFTSLTAARRLLEDQKLRPFLMVDKKALEDFEGIPQEDPNAVVIGLAPEEFHYDNMNRAMRLLQSGAILIAIHKGRYYQRNDGLALGPGPFVTALEYATGCQAQVVGKPSESFFLSSIADIGCQPSECIMIGDDVRDDIAGAQTVGMKGILVRTGKYRDGDETKVNPAPFKVVENFALAVDTVLEMF